MPPRDYYAQRTGGGSSTQNRNTGQSGGPPGRGDTGPSQAAIESARRANEASAARRAAEPVRETWRDDPEKVDEWDPSQDIIDRQEKARLDAETKMNQRAADMQKAQKLAYSMQGTKGDMRQVSNLHNLTDSQLQFLIDSGFAASEASGVLGGVSGMEAEVNKQKKAIIDRMKGGESLEQVKQSNEYRSLAKLSGGDPANIIFGMKGTKAYDNFFINDKGQKVYTTAEGYDAGYDPSGMRTWGDVESDPYLYQAHSDLLSSDLTPNKYKDYMKNIGAFGHQFPITGGPGSGWGYGGGGGGGYGGGYGGYGPAGGMTPEQMAGFYTPQANLQQAMVNVHQTPTVFRKRGGIVSLLRLS
jgi:hypothetical protein